MHIIPLHPSSSTLSIPLVAAKVQAGFPSPAESYSEAGLDFNAYLVSNATATFAVYAMGESMVGAGIEPDDLLVIDRSIEPAHRDIIIANVNGEFTLKRLILTDAGMELHPDNPSGEYAIIRAIEGVEISLVGVMTHCIKRFRRGGA